jgi:hypothetical protein
VLRDSTVKLLAARVCQRCDPVADRRGTGRAELGMHGDAHVNLGEEHGYPALRRQGASCSWSSKVSSLMPRQLGQACEGWLRTRWTSRVRGRRQSLAVLATRRVRRRIVEESGPCKT